ncbi:hypothetical protein FH972_000394 [Carpinus fangiana]|uniref:Uncharacterized protein n=1 Tax=Carpinus fangiana TaxID=176857 RepID=A0A5N6Q8Q7_9ROSI|nr:hypothetical protein FH972_000394 [Carpinus fangiana]
MPRSSRKSEPSWETPWASGFVCCKIVLVVGKLVVALFVGLIVWIPVKSNLITLIQTPPIHKCTSPLLNEDVTPTCPLFEEQLMFRHGIRIPNCYRDPSILDLFNAFNIPECENMSIYAVRRQQEPRQFPNITFLDYLSRVRVWWMGKEEDGGEMREK